MAFALVSEPAATAGSVAVQASPNPAYLGKRVVHTVGLSTSGYLNVWVSAKGFDQPRIGSLPPGSWRWECCPAEAAGAAAWHYRSSTVARPSIYRFGAMTRSRGAFLSTARPAVYSSTVSVRILQAGVRPATVMSATLLD